MSALVTTILIASLVLLIVSFPHIKTHFKDVSELALVNQSSISTTRKEDETAVYRSVDVPHGLPLNTGLRIRENYTIRDGFLNDVWLNAVVDTRENKEVNHMVICESNEPGRDTSISIGELNCLLHDISSKLNTMSVSSSIGLYAPIHKIGSISLVLASFFMVDFGKKLINITGSLKHIGPQKALEFDVVFTEYKYSAQFSELDDIQTVVVVDKDDIQEGKIVSFNKFVNTDNLSRKEEYDYKSSYEITNQLYSELNLNTGEKINYFQRNFVSSISSQLMSLPFDHNWDEKDTLLIGCPDQSKESLASCHAMLVKLLSGFLMCCERIIVLPQDKVDIEVMVSYKPTIVVLEDKKWMQITNDVLSTLSLWGKFKLERSKMLFSNGIYNSFGLFEKRLSSLRLMYSLAESNLNNRIRSGDYNLLQSLFGSRVIQERLFPGAIGPILKTNLFDYRVIQGDSKLRLRGVASNSIEIKIKDKRKLYVRGFIIGKEDSLDQDKFIEEEGWKPLNVFGKFGTDGCFYEEV